MFVHTVYFWLKQGLSADQRVAFRAGLESLKGIGAIEAAYIGVPASTSRPVIDRSYTYALTVLLDSLESHDAYQVDPIHQAFVENYATYWERVVIYDAE
ncbi:MAG: Dabb family protein [Candidatus Hydrogenedentes bacterium]|nr:Dabb family protein [Candidatus Hydrogenedentota bacterium]